jgi:hypothetical protein
MKVEAAGDVGAEDTGELLLQRVANVDQVDAERKNVSVYR